MIQAALGWALYPVTGVLIGQREDTQRYTYEKECHVKIERGSYESRNTVHS